VSLATNIVFQYMSGSGLESRKIFTLLRPTQIFPASASLARKLKQITSRVP
jgi:hypothetical protein